MCLIPLLVTGLGLVHQGDLVKLEPVPTNAMRKIGYYMPVQLKLSETRPASVKVLPADVTAPHYGELTMGGKTFAIVVDEPAGKDSRLFVDTNGDGDFTNDPATTWTPTKYKDSKGGDRTRFMGSATVAVPFAGKPTPMGLGMYLFDPSDESRAQLKDVLLYYRDYAAQGHMILGGKNYAFMLSDESAKGEYAVGTGQRPLLTLLIDRDGDGKFTPPAEQFNPGQPFNIGGTTYELSDIAKDGSSFRVAKSSKEVSEVPLPPKLDIGERALPFDAETTKGEKINFPSSYKGKVVMLDFWATWCGPCVGELPNVKKAYEQYGGKGFEILSISLDQKGDGDKLAKFTKDNNMPWSQVFDGGYWNARVAKLYGVQAIPFVLLVDGDTGKILADESTLRGPGLSAVIDKHLKAKLASAGKR